MSIFIKCEHCFGSGNKYPLTSRGRCSLCNGTGKESISEEEAKELLLQKQIRDAEL